MTTQRKASVLLGAGWWLGYLALLAPIVTYAIVRFAALYPADSLGTHPELSALYKVFVGVSGIGLAISLGIAAAAFGVRRGSVLQGILALAVGAGTTIAALSVVPIVRFPTDQYPPAALFVIADGAPLLVAFVVASLAGWVIARARRLEVAGAA